MRKLSVLVVASIATVAIGGMTAAAANKDFERVETSISAQYNQGPYDPYDPYYEEAVIKGKVKADPASNPSELAARKCKRKRKVVVKSPGGSKFAETKTDGDGKYSVSAVGAYTEPGDYTVKAKKKKKQKAKINCRPAKTTVEVTAP